MAFSTMNELEQLADSRDWDALIGHSKIVWSGVAKKTFVQSESCSEVRVHIAMIRVPHDLELRFSFTFVFEDIFSYLQLRVLKL